MATVDSKIIELVVKRKIDTEIISDTKLRQAIDKTQAIVPDLWRKQLNDGIGEDGKRIRKLSKGYTKFKSRFINKKIKHRAKTMNKAWYEELTIKTDYAAKGVPNYGRFTGQAFSAMATKKPETDYKDGVIKASFVAYINNEKRALIWKYLEKIGLKYGFNLGNNPRGQKHQQIIKETFLKKLFPKATLFSAKVNVK